MVEDIYTIESDELKIIESLKRRKSLKYKVIDFTKTENIYHLTVLELFKRLPDFNEIYVALEKDVKKLFLHILVKSCIRIPKKNRKKVKIEFYLKVLQSQCLCRFMIGCGNRI